jgi:hypothetical protein
MPDVLKLDRHGISTTPTSARATHKAAVDFEHDEAHRTASNGHDAMQKPTIADTSIARLRIRMEALEHLVIILLADNQSRGVRSVRELLNDVPFWTDPTHNVESRCAAAHMIRLVERSDRLRSDATAD